MQLCNLIKTTRLYYEKFWMKDRISLSFVSYRLILNPGIVFVCINNYINFNQQRTLLMVPYSVLLEDYLYISPDFVININREMMIEIVVVFILPILNHYVQLNNHYRINESYLRTESLSNLFRNVFPTT